MITTHKGGAANIMGEPKGKAGQSNSYLGRELDRIPTDYGTDRSYLYRCNSDYLPVPFQWSRFSVSLSSSDFSCAWLDSDRLPLTFCAKLA